MTEQQAQLQKARQLLQQCLELGALNPRKKLSREIKALLKDPLNQDAQCPWCKQRCKPIQVAEYNIDSYHTPVHALTECCGNIVYMQESATVYQFERSNQKTDSWGNEACPK